MSQLFSAKVKNVLSADTFVLVPAKSNQVPAPERLLTLSYVRGESFEAREALRQLLIGKELKFKVLYKAPSGREFGDLQAPVFSSLVEFALQKGWVKLKDNNEDSEYTESLAEIEARARKERVGVWDEPAEPTLVPLDDATIELSQKKPLPTIVEKVISGDRIVVRVLISEKEHFSGPVLLAGLRAPRTDEPSQQKMAFQAKQFVEDRLLTKTQVAVRIIGKSQTGVPLAIIEHPSGNDIHEKLLENGFAEIVDWQSTLVGSSTMGRYRKAEQTAKALGRGLFATHTKPATPDAASTSSRKALRPGATVEGVTVAKVVNADTLVLRLANDEEITVQLASLRAPRPNDSTVTSGGAQQQALVNTAREFVRKEAIGKTVSVFVDGFRNANESLGLEARFLVSVKLNGAIDLSELIVSNGFATIIRHNKATSGERSLNWDKLLELEEEQKKAAKKGIWFSGDINKILTVGTRIVDASENASKAKTFFNGFQQKGRISGGFFVEFVSSVNRVKLFNPKEGLKLTLILGGLSNSRKSEDGLKYMNKRFLQRNVEFEVYDTDKVGGFIGNLYANSKALLPVQTQLLEAGYTSIHEIAVGSNIFSSDFTKSEDAAKAGKKGIWADYDEAAVQRELDANTQKMAQLLVEAAKPKFFDIEVTDIDKAGVISYHQVDASNLFTGFKLEFNKFHAQVVSSSSASADLPYNLAKAPKRGELVSAKFSENGKYYRARVTNFDRASNKYEVKHVDFGNFDKVALSSLRGLPTKFSLAAYAPFAHTARLQHVRLPPNKPTDYLTEALYALEDLILDKKLVISAIPSTAPGVEFDVVLYDSEASIKDPSYTINKQMVSEGWGIVEGTTGAGIVSELLVAQKQAKSDHLGCWEFGDVSFNDEEQRGF